MLEHPLETILIQLTVISKYSSPKDIKNLVSHVFVLFINLGSTTDIRFLSFDQVAKRNFN